MLKLKKLQILGFKSFCDRTELKFHGDGVAAIYLERIRVLASAEGAWEDAVQLEKL